MPRHPQRESLAGPGTPHHHRHPGATLAEVADHRLLVLASRGVGLKGGADGVMANHGGPLPDPAGGGSDQPLLHGQQLRSGPAALLQRPLGDHADGPLGHEPVGRPAPQARPGWRRRAHRQAQR